MISKLWLPVIITQIYSHHNLPNDVTVSVDAKAPPLKAMEGSAIVLKAPYLGSVMIIQYSILYVKCQGTTYQSTCGLRKQNTMLL